MEQTLLNMQSKAKIKIAIECEVCGQTFFVDRPTSNGIPFTNVLRCHLPSKCNDCAGRSKDWNWSKAAKGKRKADRQAQKRQEMVFICRHCGVEFKGRKRKFCSQKCREENIRTRRLDIAFEKVCIVCGKTFFAKQKTAKTCGITCRRKHKASKRIATWKSKHKGVAFPQLPAHQKRGNAAEYLCDAFCVLYGIPCFAPVANNQPAVDRVVWMDEHLQTVQIKTVCTKTESGVGTANMAMPDDAREHVDLYCAVDVDTGYVRFIDRDQVSLFGDRVAVPSPADIVMTQ